MSASVSVNMGSVYWSATFAALAAWLLAACALLGATEIRAASLNPYVVTIEQVSSSVEVGQVLICDTQQQAERVGALMHGDAQTALTAVNADEHPGACGLANVAYIPGATLSSVRTAEESFEIGPILVLGIVSEAGMQAVTPNVYFILRKIDERVA